MAKKCNYTIKSAKDEEGNAVNLSDLSAELPKIELFDSVITLTKVASGDFALDVKLAD